MSGGKKPKAQIVGYQYHIGIHAALCHGPVDEVIDITYGNKLAFGKDADGNGEDPLTSSTVVVIDKPELMGGRAREGGLKGVVDVLFGEATQIQNGYLKGAIGGSIPAYRGIVSLVFRKFYWGTNPYIKPFAVRVKRHPKWLSTTNASIGRDANPAHIIYDCLTNDDWGMGYARSNIDVDNFNAVAAVLAGEKFGLSFLWVAQQSIYDFLKDVMDHIGGVLRLSPSTGQFQIKLIRDDYVDGDVPIIAAEDVVAIDSYQRPGWGEVINEISVKYTNRESGDTSVISVQNSANIAAQGSIVNQTKNFLGINESELAQKVAQRELQIVSAPLSKISVKINRAAYSLRIGDVFKLNWPRLGLNRVVFRISRIDYGTLEDHSISIEGIEDIFSLPTTSYVDIQPIGWVDPRSPPTAVPDSYVAEIPYYEIATLESDEHAESLTANEDYVGLSAARPSGDARTWQLARQEGSNWTDQGQTSFMSTGVLQDRMTLQDTAVRTTLSGDALTVEEDTVVVFTDAATRQVEEYGLIQALDTLSLTELPLLTLIRGVYDTTPKEHHAGTKVYFLNDRVLSDEDTHASGAVLKYRQLSVTSQGTLDIDDAPDVNVTVLQRQARPYAPGQVRVNGVSSLDEFSGTAKFQWAHRDRTQQTAALVVEQDDGNVGPETNVTYDLNIYGETGALLHAVTGIVGTEYEYVDEEVDSRLEFRILAQESWRELEAWREVQNGDDALHDDEASVLAAQLLLLTGDNTQLDTLYGGVATEDSWKEDPYRRVDYKERRYNVLRGTTQVGTAIVMAEKPRPGWVWSDETRTRTMVDPAGGAFYRLNGNLTLELWSERDGTESWQRQRVQFRRSNLVGAGTPTGAVVGTGGPSVLQFRFTESAVHPGLADQFVALSELKLFTKPNGANVATSLTVTPQETYGNYSATGLNDGLLTANWAALALPKNVTIDLPAGIGVHSYAFTGPQGGGNEPYGPTGWEVWAGPDVDNLELIEVVSGQTPPAPGVDHFHRMPVSAANIKGARLKFYANQGGTPGQSVQFRQLEFRRNLNVAQDHLADGDTPFASSVWNNDLPGFSQDHAFDGLDTTVWSSANNALPATLGVLFADPPPATPQINVRAVAADLDYRPGQTDYEISYDTTDGDDGTWQLVESFTNLIPTPDVDHLYGIGTLPCPELAQTGFTYRLGSGIATADRIDANVENSTSGRHATNIIGDSTFDIGSGVEITLEFSSTNASWYTSGGHTYHLGFGVVQADQPADLIWQTQTWAYARPFGKDIPSSATQSPLPNVGVLWNAHNVNSKGAFLSHLVNVSFDDYTEYDAAHTALNLPAGPAKVKLTLEPSGTDLKVSFLLDGMTLPVQHTFSNMEFPDPVRLLFYQTDYSNTHVVVWDSIKVHRLCHTNSWKFLRMEIEEASNSSHNSSPAATVSMAELEIYDVNGANIALSGTATASQYRTVSSNYHPNKANDGDRNSSGYSFAKRWTADVPCPHWYQIELPQESLIASYEVWTATDTLYGQPTKWVMKGSLDGTIWEEVDRYQSATGIAQGGSIARYL